ncbi:MAG: hypothetical protein ACR2PZ_05170 [Pseudomonadales bacterium]
MNAYSENANGPGLRGILYPIAFAALLPILANALIWLGSRQPERFFEEPAIMLFNVAWACMPFVVWAIVGSFNQRMARTYGSVTAAGLLAMLAAWGWVAWEGYRHQTAEWVDSANLGLGFVMLVLPVLVFALMLGVSVMISSGSNARR